MSKVEVLLKSHYREVTSDEAPALFAEVKRLAEKAKMESPKIYFKKPADAFMHTSPMAKYTNTMLDWMIGVLPGNHMIMGSKAMAALNVPEATSLVSEELSAVIAHEFGHIKNNDLDTVRWLNKSPIIGMAVAMTALAMFEHYHKHKDKERPIEEKLPGEKGYSVELEEKEHKSIMGMLLTSAKYLAAGAIGLTAGIFAIKLGRHKMEFRADKFSQELLGAGKPLAKALKKLSEEIAKEGERLVETLKGMGMSESAISRVKLINKFVSSLTHPPVEARIERLGGI